MQLACGMSSECPGLSNRQGLLSHHGVGWRCPGCDLLRSPDFRIVSNRHDDKVADRMKHTWKKMMNVQKFDVFIEVYCAAQHELGQLRISSAVPTNLFQL